MLLAVAALFAAGSAARAEERPAASVGDGEGAAPAAADAPAAEAPPAPEAPPTAEAPAAAVEDGDPSRTEDFGGAVESGDSGLGGDQHRVDPGDTLWDISEKYLGNPWYWPKVWSYNPAIENPHWIYPGDEIRLSPDGGDFEAAQKKDLGDVSKGTLDRPDYGEDDDVTVAGKIGYEGRTALRTRGDGFITAQELAESGRIASSPEEKEHLLEGDRIYLRWDDRSNLRVGERYVLYRTRAEVRHPVTGDEVGYLTQILGHARVVAADPKEQFVVAVIERSYSEILRGDLVGPAGVKGARRIVQRPNAVDLSGTIVTALQDDATQWGQWDLVFVDRGRKQGVEEGNTFDVLRRGDGLDYDGYTPPREQGYPVERVGRLVVVDVKEDAAAAVVLWAIHELHPGDRVTMHASAE
jgi:hypothetical protein